MKVEKLSTDSEVIIQCALMAYISDLEDLLKSLGPLTDGSTGERLEEARNALVEVRNGSLFIAAR